MHVAVAVSPDRPATLTLIHRITEAFITRTTTANANTQAPCPPSVPPVMSRLYVVQDFFFFEAAIQALRSSRLGSIGAFLSSSQSFSHCTILHLVLRTYCQQEVCILLNPHLLCCIVLSLYQYTLIFFYSIAVAVSIITNLWSSIYQSSNCRSSPINVAITTQEAAFVSHKHQSTW